MLVNNYKPYIYTITLSFSILANFYIGYMICLFCIIYFIFLILTTNYTTINNKLNYIKQRCLSFSLYSFIAGGICSFILLPTIYIIASSDSGSIGFYKSIGTYYSSIESFFRQMMSANPTYWHHPYIYSTVLSFLFVPIFFFSTSIPLNKKNWKRFIVYNNDYFISNKYSGLYLERFSQSKLFCRKAIFRIYFYCYNNDS